MVFEIDTLFCELTNRCNSNCIMCTHQFMKRPEHDMKISMVDDILERIKPKTIIYHFFGEPMLYTGLGSVILSANQRGIKTIVDTNAQLLTPLWFQYLSRCGLDKVIISFGATTKETYEKIWRGLDFDVVTKNIKGIINIKRENKLKTEIHIRNIITKENKYEVISKDYIWSDLSKNITMSFVEEFHLYGYDRVPWKRRKVKNCLERARLDKEIVIKSNGDIILCCADLDGKYVMGNIQEESIRDIYYGNKFMEFRNRVYNNIDPPDICVECGVRPW